jgi:hypothetical protein
LYIERFKLICRRLSMYLVKIRSFSNHLIELRVKVEDIIVGRGTVETQPEYIPRTKIDVIVRDDQVEQLVSTLTDRLGSESGGTTRKSYLFRIFPLL